MWYWLTVQSTWTLTMEVCTHIIYTINTTWLNAYQSVIYLQIIPIIIGTCCFLFFDGRLICVSEKHFPYSKQYISYLTKLAQGRCNVMISRTYSFFWVPSCYMVTTLHCDWRALILVCSGFVVPGRPFRSGENNKRGGKTNPHPHWAFEQYSKNSQCKSPLFQLHMIFKNMFY